MNNTAHSNFVNFASSNIYHDTNFVQLTNNGSDGYFKPRHAYNIEEACGINKYNILVNFMNNDSIYDYTPFGVSSVTGLLGPEVGLPNLEDVKQELIAFGYTDKEIEEMINDVVVENTVFYGISLEKVRYDTESYSTHERVFGLQYHGTTTFTNFTEGQLFFGQPLEYCLISKDSLDGFNPSHYPKSVELSNGQFIFAFRPHKLTTIVGSITQKLKLYFKNPEIHKRLYSPDSIIGTAVTSSCYSTEQFAKIYGLNYLYTLLKLTDLRLVMQDNTQNVNISKQQMGNNYDHKPYDYKYKGLFAEMFLNENDFTQIGNLDLLEISSMSPEDIICGLAVIHNVINPSEIEQDNSPFSYYLSRKFRRERQNNGNSEMLEQVANFNDEFNKFLFEGIAKNGMEYEFGIDLENMTNEKSRESDSNVFIPKVTTDYGRVLMQFLDCPKRMIRSMQQFFLVENRKNVAICTRPANKRNHAYAYLK